MLTPATTSSQCSKGTLFHRIDWLHGNESGSTQPFGWKTEKETWMRPTEILWERDQKGES